MQNVSQFQHQFPLSHKKFYKKVVGKVLPILFFSLTIYVFLSLGLFALGFHRIGQSSISATSLFGMYAFGALAFAILWMIIYGFYVNAYIKRYYYDSTDFITIKKGVFAPAEIHVQYQKIQDVYVDQDIMDRIFGIYDVHIASATYSSGIEAHIDGVDAHIAEGLKNFILGKIQGTTPVQTASSVSPAVSAAPATINFSEEISSKTFPIDSKWYVQVVLSNIIGSMLYSLIIFYWAGLKSVQPSVDSIWIWVAVFVGFAIFGIIRILLWKAKFYFIFSPQFVMQKTGVIATQEKHLPYKSIQDVMIKQGLLEKVLGLSTVIVQNASNSGMSNNMYSRRSSRMNSADVVIPGQPIAKGQKLVEELNKVLAHRTDSMGL